jgi:hypothetical protein
VSTLYIYYSVCENHFGVTIPSFKASMAALSD